MVFTANAEAKVALMRALHGAGHDRAPDLRVSLLAGAVAGMSYWVGAYSMAMVRYLRLRPQAPAISFLSLPPADSSHVRFFLSCGRLNYDEMKSQLIAYEMEVNCSKIQSAAM